MNNLRGAKIIYQESKATQPSHLYFLQKDANYCEIIVTSESGVKRKLNFNVDLSNYYTKNETYSQNEIDNSLALKLDKETYIGTASDLFLNDQNLLQSLQNEQSARYYADQGLENSKQVVVWLKIRINDIVQKI